MLLVLTIKTITFFNEFAKKIDLIDGSRWESDINIKFSKKINYFLECLQIRKLYIAINISYNIKNRKYYYINILN